MVQRYCHHEGSIHCDRVREVWRTRPHCSAPLRAVNPPGRSELCCLAQGTWRVQLHLVTALPDTVCRALPVHERWAKCDLSTCHTLCCSMAHLYECTLRRICSSASDVLHARELA